MFDRPTQSHDIVENRPLNFQRQVMHLTRMMARDHHAVTGEKLVLANHDDGMFANRDQTVEVAGNSGRDIPTKRALSYQLI